MINEDILEIGELATVDERRKFDRRAVTVEIQFSGGDARGTATTRDIGIGGLYIVTDADLPENSQLSMRINLGSRNLLLNGIVTYRDPGVGVGVRFQHLSREAENVLRGEFPLD